MFTWEEIKGNVLFVVRFYTHSRLVVPYADVPAASRAHGDDLRDAEIVSIERQYEEYRQFVTDYCNYVYSPNGYLSLEDYYSLVYVPANSSEARPTNEATKTLAEKIDDLQKEIREKEKELKELRKQFNQTLR